MHFLFQQQTVTDPLKASQKHKCTLGFKMQFAEKRMWNHVLSPAETVTCIQSYALCLWRKRLPVQWLSPAIRFLYPPSSKAANIFLSQPKVVFPAIFLAEKLQAAWMYLRNRWLDCVFLPPRGFLYRLLGGNYRAGVLCHWLFPLITGENSDIITVAVTQLCTQEHASCFTCCICTCCVLCFLLILYRKSLSLSFTAAAVTAVYKLCDNPQCAAYCKRVPSPLSAMLLLPAQRLHCETMCVFM